MEAARNTRSATGRAEPDAPWRAPDELHRDPNPALGRRLLHVAYDLSWVLAIVLASPWLLYRGLRTPGFASMVLGRLGRGLGAIPAPTRTRVLVHGVSVGEVKAALSIVHALEEAHPDLEVVLSTTTNTGWEVATKLFPEHHVVRFPADVSWVVRRFLRRVDPALVLLIELEIWPNFLRACNRQRRTVAVVNGRITRMSHAYYVLSRKVLPQFNRVSLFCVQLEEYARRFLELGVDPARVLVTGNVKVDGLRSGGVDPGDELRRLLGGREGQAVVVAGSTHEPEELIVARAWHAHAPGTRLVIVPRHPHRSGGIAQALTAQGHRVQRLSELRAGAAAPDAAAVALVDTIGELERIFALADVVFMGGSLIPHGGQNMLEPAAQGRPVVFGPHVDNFAQEVAILRAYGGCRALEPDEDLGPVLRALLDDREERTRMGLAGMEAVAAQRGASAKTLRALDALVLERLSAGAPPG